MQPSVSLMFLPYLMSSSCDLLICTEPWHCGIYLFYVIMEQKIVKMVMSSMSVLSSRSCVRTCQMHNSAHQDIQFQWISLIYSMDDFHQPII